MLCDTVAIVIAAAFLVYSFHGLQATWNENGLVTHEPSFSQAQNADYEYRLFAHNAQLQGSITMPNITLVSHVTIDRLHHVQRWCRQYRGPMSISIFIRPHIDDESHVLQQFLDDNCIVVHADLHVTRELRSAEAKDMMANYPFNVQRNTAVKGCRGAMMMLMDIDFHLMPRGNSARETSLRAALETSVAKLRQEWANEQTLRRVAPRWFVTKDTHNSAEQVAQKLLPSGLSSDVVRRYLHPTVDDVLQGAVFVIPAVETVHRNLSLPSTFESLRAAVLDYSVCSFYGHYCRACHLPTDLQRYLQVASLEPQERLPYVVDFMEGYEPYVILNKSSFGKGAMGLVSSNLDDVEHRFQFGAACGGVGGGRTCLPLETHPTVPKYDESFIGRGWDKMSFFVELAAQRRPFVVLPHRHFLAHAGRGDMPTFLTEEYKRRQEINRDLMGKFNEHIAALYRPFSRGVGSKVLLQQYPVLQQLHRDIDFDLLSIAEKIKPLTLDSILWHAVARVPLMRDFASKSSDSSLTCISSLRPEQFLDHSDKELPRRVQLLRDAVDFACGVMSCEALRNNGLRHYPRALIAHADWVFDRWFQHAVFNLRESPHVACSFNGAAQLVNASDEIGPLRLGCALDQEVSSNRSMLESLLNRICGGDTTDDDIGNRVAIGHDGCTAVFQQVEPEFLRQDLRLQVSLALLLHHLVFDAAGFGCTCACLFGEIATFVAVPRNALI